jgi:ABC-type lipoprotein export system ATPase subunit
MDGLVIELRDVFCVHRTPDGDAAALQGASLTVDRGELVAVIGRSGAGKTTLLNTIAGMQTPSAGSVLVGGRDVGRLPSRSRARLRHELIGFLGQRADTALPPDLRVRQAVELPLRLRGIPATASRPRAAELLSAVGLEDCAGALPAQLSGGERQRVALCAALAHRPALLLADEPTAELDAHSARAVLDLISTLVGEQGITAIIVSHDPATEAIADRTVTIRGGRVYGDRERPPTTPAAPPAPEAGWTPSTVELDGVSRIRGRPVLTGFSHRFGPGGLTVITGPSGTGKTTLLRLLAGLDLPDAGRLLLDGAPFGDPEQRATVRRERIGYMPQEPAPVGFLSARENIALALQVRTGSEPDFVTDAALARVGLAHRARQRVARLSAGEAQRVALARALACARGLLLVDEPTSRLDEANAVMVAELLKAENQTVVCATHDPELVRRADDVLRLK